MACKSRSFRRSLRHTIAHGPRMAVGWLVRVGLSVGVSAITIHGALVVVLVLIAIIIIVMFNLICGLIILVLVSGLVVVLFILPKGRLLVFLIVLWFVLVGLSVGDVLLVVAI